MENQSPVRVAQRFIDAASTAKSIALMRFLSTIARGLGVAEHVYVVGGAVRNFLIDQPIKDIDVVIDSVALGKGRDSDWFARQVVRAIPARASHVTNQYGVAIITVGGRWVLDGHDLQGEVIEIANARAESYADGGYKPEEVVPSTIQEDVVRREFTFNCMAGDTFIPTARGILRIDQIASRKDGEQQKINLTVAGPDGPATAVGWQYSGYAPTLRVTTEWGHSFACTHHHPVLVLRGHEHNWVQADQLKVGDLLCVPIRQITRQEPLVLDLPDPVQPKRGRLKDARKPEKMTPILAFLIGCVVAEGSNTHKRVSFSNSDPMLLSRYTECFQATFGFQPSRNKVVEKGSVRVLQGVQFVASKDGYDIYADSRAVVDWLEDLGLYCGGPKDGKSASHYKVVPWSILQADERSQCAFLAAYLECDGSIHPDTGRITFCSASPHIRQQLQVLLGAHGILSKVKDRFVYLNAVDSAFLWEKIQPWMVTKGFDYTQRDNKARNRYGIPANYIRGFLSGRRRKTTRQGVVYATDGEGSKTLTNVQEPVRKIQRFLHDAYARGDFDGFMANLKAISPTEHAKLQRLFDLGYHYVEVTSVEDAGSQDVFDLSMGEGVEPAFVANGVVVHNTLLWRLLDVAQGPDKAEIIDLTGCGLRDLERREMRCPREPDIVFTDDASRMLRAIKFAFKYGFKIPPDVAASIRRNAPALRRVPSNQVGTILIDTILSEPTYRKALAAMDDLGLLDVVRDMLVNPRDADDEALKTWLIRHAKGREMGFLFDLLDVGLPVGAPFRFLSTTEQRQVREITLGMDRDTAWAFLEGLKTPGTVYRDKGFFPGLLRKYGIKGRDIQAFNRDVFMPAAREILLDSPDLMQQGDAFRRLLEREVNHRMR